MARIASGLQHQAIREVEGRLPPILLKRRSHRGGILDREVAVVEQHLHRGGYTAGVELVEAELDLRREQLAASWTVLRQYGNMSSAAVLFVVAEMLKNPPAQPGDLGIVVAFGPGVSGEIVLARWEQ